MNNSESIVYIIFLICSIPVVVFFSIMGIKELIAHKKIERSISFPEINEIEYRDPVDDYSDPEIGSFYIKKENAEKNPFVYPRYIYRVDSIKKNYYGETWVKVTSKCYDLNSYSTYYSPTECIPLEVFLNENSRIYKSEIRNIDTYKSDMLNIEKKKIWHLSNNKTVKTV